MNTVEYLQFLDSVRKMKDADLLPEFFVIPKDVSVEELQNEVRQYQIESSKKLPDDMKRSDVIRERLRKKLEERKKKEVHEITFIK
jgi:hypothetical protein